MAMFPWFSFINNETLINCHFIAPVKVGFQGYFCYHFSYFSIKMYIETAHKNGLLEMVLLKGHIICFH